MWIQPESIVVTRQLFPNKSSGCLSVFRFPCYLLGNQARRCCRMSLVCRMWGFNLHNIKQRTRENTAQSSFISGLWAVGLLLFCLCFPAQLCPILSRTAYFPAKVRRRDRGILQTEDVMWSGPPSLPDNIFSRQADPSLPSSPFEDWDVITFCLLRGSQLTPHTSQLTPHTSHLILTPHSSQLTPHTSQLTPYTSHLTAYTL